MSKNNVIGELPPGCQVVIGALAPPFHEQLGMDPQAVNAHQKDANALNRLRIRGVITQAEAERAERRLVRELGRTVSSLGPPEGEGGK